MMNQAQPDFTKGVDPAILLTFRLLLAELSDMGQERVSDLRHQLCVAVQEHGPAEWRTLDALPACAVLLAMALAPLLERADLVLAEMNTGAWDQGGPTMGRPN